jgi:Family of unknown function (DUF6158)
VTGGTHELDGVPATELENDDLERELAHIHETRHDVFLHGSAQALDHHTERMTDLEGEYLRRHPHRELDPQRLRAGARSRGGPER